MKRIQAGILIFDEVEVLDFRGPFEVFSITRMNEEKRLEEPSPFEVFLIAEKADPIMTTGGMRVIPDHPLEQCPPLDILVVPGGSGTRREMNNSRLIGWIGERAKQAGTVASVCTGSLLLGKAGLLDGRRATTHWAFLDPMEKLLPGTTVEKESRFVADGIHRKGQSSEGRSGLAPGQGERQENHRQRDRSSGSLGWTGK